MWVSIQFGKLCSGVNTEKCIVGSISGTPEHQDWAG